MRKRAAICATTVILSVASVGFLAAPAQAADTPVLVQIDGGTLSITAPVGEVAAAPITASVAAQTIAFELGQVGVADNVGGVAGWAASVVVSAFVSSNDGALSLEGGTYVPNAVATTGIVTATPATSATLAAATTVVTGTAASGVNAATWTPTLNLQVPAGALAGTYTSTVTHSVL